MVEFEPVMASESFARLLGYPSASSVLNRRSLATLFKHPDRIAKRIREVMSSEGTEGWVRFDAQAIRADGSVVWLDQTLERVELGDAAAVVCSSQDASDREAREARIRDLNAALLDRVRSNAMREMANALSHRLSQPRAAVLNYLNAARLSLGRSCDPERAMLLLQRALSEADRLNEILAEIEQIASLEPGDEVATDLNEVTLEVYHSISGDVGTDRLPMTLQLHETAGQVSAAKERLQEAVLHLAWCGVRSAASSASSRFTLSTARCDEHASRVSVAIDGMDVTPPEPEDLRLLAAVVDAEEGWVEADGNTGHVEVSIVLPGCTPADASRR